jgi:predicted GNAT family acetyltransferase
MQIQRFHTVAAYAAAAEPFLLRREAANCFFLGQITQLKEPTDALLLVAHDADGPLAVATMTRGRHMMMTAAPPPAVHAILDYVFEQRIDVPGIASSPDAANAFARRWCDITGTTARVHMRMATHQLTAVIPPRPVAGAMRFAATGDHELVARWIQEFRESVGEGHLRDPRAVAEDGVRNREIALWDDAGVPVAMAGAIGPTRNGIRIVLVYTPPRYRKRGYASNLVAALSQHQLDAGRTLCFLNTNLENPTPNKIYRELGYRPVSEFLILMFDRPPDAR